MKRKTRKLLGKMLSVTLATALLLSANIVGTSAVWIDSEEVPESIYEYPYWDTSLTPEERATDLLSRMSLYEKAEFLHSRPAVSGQINAVPRLGVGSYIWPTAGLHGVANMQGMLQNFGKVHSPNGEPWQDGTATSFPSTLGQGTTWNPDLIAEMGKEIGYELRVYYNTSTKGLTAGGPGFNLSRDPRWGRSDESFGEDVLLASIMGQEFVNGYQGVYDDEEIITAIPVVKHFAANNAENERYNTSANMTEAELREYYLRTFENVIKESDPQGIMLGFNAINGVPNHSNYKLMTELAQETWGFTGYFSSDNGGVGNLNGYYGANGSNVKKGLAEENPERYPVLENVTSEAEAAAAYVKAGGAHDLGGGDKPVAKWAVYCVENGLLTEDELDKAVMQELVVRFRTGEFDLENTEYDDLTLVKDLMLQEEVQNLNLSMAEQSIVVLENKNDVLPLAKPESGDLVCDYDNVVVVGKYVDEMQVTGYTSGNPEWKDELIRVSFWEGLESTYKELNPNGTISLITPDGDKNGDWNILSGNVNEIEAADLIIYIPYDNKNDGGEFKDFTDYQLGHNQYDIGTQLIEIANEKEIPIVINMMTASARELTPWLDDDGNFKGDALVWETFLGDKQGEALANVLFGKTPASGRLTMSWYADEDQLGDLQNDYALYPDAESEYNGRTYMYFTGDIRYPFGYGLTYSDFDYSNLSLSDDAVTGNDTLTVRVDVTNDSAVDGYDVVQVYVKSPNAEENNRPNQQLAGFQKVWVEAGDTEHVDIEIDISDLAFWNEEDGCFSCDLGEYTLYIGSDCMTPVLEEKKFDITADISEKLYMASIKAEAFVSEEIGEEIATRTSAALINDTYYANVDEMPDGMTVAYSSTNADVATVDENGVITTVGAGVCSIVATVSYNGASVSGSTPICVQLDKNPWLNVDQDDWYYDYAVYLWESGEIMIPYEVGGEYPNQREEVIYDLEDSYFDLTANCIANPDGSYTYPGEDFIFDTDDDEIITPEDPRYADFEENEGWEEEIPLYILSNSAITNTGFGYTTKISIAPEDGVVSLSNPVLAVVGTMTNGSVAAWTVDLSAVTGEVATLSFGSGMDSVTIYLLDGMIDFSDVTFGGCKSNVLTFDVQ